MLLWSRQGRVGPAAPPWDGLRRGWELGRAHTLSRAPSRRWRWKSSGRVMVILACEHIWHPDIAMVLLEGPMSQQHTA
jgi:hypothetical protein